MSLPKPTITRSWSARDETFTSEVAASPLAAAPYAVRHAAVSTWLTGECDRPRSPSGPEQSVEILFRIYAKCLDGGEAELHRRIENDPAFVVLDGIWPLPPRGSSRM